MMPSNPIIQGKSSFPDLSALVTYNLCTRRDFRDRRGNSRYREASAFLDVSASVTCRVSFAEITGSLSKCRFQPSAFPDVLTSITCRVSFAEITGSLSNADSRYRRGTCFSRRVSACHMHTQLYGNHGQSVDDFW
ncbi:hypothetical protein ACFX1W_046950 [Malus domestica]